MNKSFKYLLGIVLTIGAFCSASFTCNGCSSQSNSTPVPSVGSTRVKAKPVVWPKVLPAPKQKMVRQNPPTSWTNPKGPQDDVFELYTDKLALTAEGKTEVRSVQEILSYANQPGFDPEKIGPIYLLHKRATDGLQELVGWSLTLDVKANGESGQRSFILTAHEKDVVQLHRLNHVIPRSRPLSVNERQQLVDAYCRLEKLMVADIVCEAAIVIRHSRNGATVTGFGAAVPDYKEAKQLDSGMLSLTSFWITNWYIFHPTKNIYYAQEPPSFWK